MILELQNYKGSLIHQQVSTCHLALIRHVTVSQKIQIIVPPRELHLLTLKQVISDGSVYTMGDSF